MSELENILEEAMEEALVEPQVNKTNIDRSFNMDHVNEMVDMSSLAKVYQQDLKTLQAARLDMMKKAHWIDNTIKLLDRRIQINLDALKTLQTPHAMPKSEHNIIDSE